MEQQDYRCRSNPQFPMSSRQFFPGPSSGFECQFRVIIKYRVAHCSFGPSPGHWVCFVSAASALRIAGGRPLDQTSSINDPERGSHMHQSPEHNPTPRAGRSNI